MPLVLDEPAIVFPKLRESLQPDEAKQNAAARELFQRVAESANLAGFRAKTSNGQPGNAPMLTVLFANVPPAEFIFAGAIWFIEFNRAKTAARLKRRSPDGELEIDLAYNPAGSGSFEALDQFGGRYSAEAVMAALIVDRMQSR